LTNKIDKERLSKDLDDYGIDVIKKKRIWLSKNNNKGWLSKVDSYDRQTNIKKLEVDTTEVED
jgi:hypothetical protein